MSSDLLRPRRALALVLVAAAVLAAAVAAPASAHEGKTTTTVVQEGTGRFKTVFVWETRDVFETQDVYEWKWGWYYIQVPNMVRVRVKVPRTWCGTGWPYAAPGVYACHTGYVWQMQEVQEGTKSVRRYGMKRVKTGTKQVKTGTETVRVPKRVEITRPKTVTNTVHDDGCTSPSQPSQHSTAPANHRATSIYFDEYGHNCVTYRSTVSQGPSLGDIAKSVAKNVEKALETAGTTLQDAVETAVRTANRLVCSPDGQILTSAAFGTMSGIVAVSPGVGFGAGVGAAIYLRETCEDLYPTAAAAPAATPDPTPSATPTQPTAVPEQPATLTSADIIQAQRDLQAGKITRDQHREIARRWDCQRGFKSRC